MKTPVLFLIFNRPDTAKQVFEQIRKAKPKQLFVAADGPRDNKPDENEKCTMTRKIIMDEIDWECEVVTLFRDTNLGCRLAVSESITWFFENVEEGIILEDDCVPDISFFHYCELMLKRYKNEKRVMTITGANFQDGVTRGDGSYYFSKYPQIWGWATWRRAWQLYDVEMKKWPEFEKTKLLKACNNNKMHRDYWKRTIDNVFHSKVDTWDAQWLFTSFYYGAFTISPNINLITNIGFEENATHTTNPSDRLANMEARSYLIDKVPTKFETDLEADIYTFKKLYYPSIHSKFNKYKMYFNVKKKVYKTVKMIFSKVFQSKNFSYF